MENSMTVRELAERLALTEMTVYKAVRDGEIPHYRINRTIRFDRQTIEEWIQAGGSAAESEMAASA